MIKYPMTVEPMSAERIAGVNHRNCIDLGSISIAYDPALQVKSEPDFLRQLSPLLPVLDPQKLKKGDYVHPESQEASPSPTGLPQEDIYGHTPLRALKTRQPPLKATRLNPVNSNSWITSQSKSIPLKVKMPKFKRERRTLHKDDKNFTFTNRTTTIKMALLVFMLLIGQASGQGNNIDITVPNSSGDTTATATAMPGIVDGGVDFLPIITGFQVSTPIAVGVSLGASSLFNLKVIGYQGIVLCQINKGVSVDTKALAIQDPFKLYLGESPSVGLASMHTFSLAYAYPNWQLSEVAQAALTTSPSNGSLTPFSGAKASWPSTQIVYFGQTGAQIFELNFQATTNKGLERAITGTNANLISGAMIFLQKTTGDTLLFATASNSRIYIVNRTDMVLSQEVTTTATTAYGMTNNLDETQLLYVESTQLAAVKKGGLTGAYGSSIVDLGTYGIITEGSATFLLNFGSYNYLGISVAAAQPFLRILEKTTLVKMKDLAGISKTNSFLNRWGPGIQGDTPSYFGLFRPTAPFNFQSYYIRFDGCKVRDAAFICQTCHDTTYVKSSLAAYNQCVNQYSIPFRNGKDTSEGTYKPCATGCSQCNSDYLVCTACDYLAASPNDYWLDGTVCVQGSAITGSKGKNTQTGSLTNCQTANCSDCKSDYRVCLACDAATDWWLNGSVCVNTSGIPAGYGKLGTTGRLALCPVGCIDCRSNSAQCTTCDTSKDYWMHNSACVVGGLLPMGLGRKVGTQLAELCMTGCLQCNANSAQCTSCDTSVDQWLKNQVCVHGSSLGPGEGRNQNLGMIIACSVNGCIDCKVNNMSCVLCDKPNGFWIFNNSCINDAGIPPGFGKKDSDGTIQPCSSTISTGCLDCKANHTVCSKCDKDNDFWLESGACVAGPSIGSLKGKKLADGTVATCSVTGCLDCKSNSVSCSQCDKNNDFWLENGTCVVGTAIGALKGKKSLDGTVASCSTNGCLDCKQDFSKCAQCDKANNWWLEVDTCVLGVLIPAGKGKRDSDGTVQPCSGPAGCQECQASHTVCTKCDKANDFWLENGTCVVGTAIGALKGKKSLDGTVASCSTNGCLDCKQDFSKCAQCDKANNWWLEVDTCVLGVLIPTGKGKRDSDGTIQPCSSTISTGCLDCKANHTVCSKCDKDNDFWLESGACVAGPSIGSLKGKKLADGTVATCSVTGCLDCKSNSVSCSQCDKNNDFWLENGTCVVGTAIGALKGKKSLDGTVASCSTNGCLDCKQDFSKCAQCDKANNWWLEVDTCVLGVLIPAGKGKRDSDGTVQPCSGPAGCQECQASHTVCTKCDKANDFWLESGACVVGTAIGASKGRHTSEGTILSCESAGCLDCKASFSACVACDKDNDWWLESKACIKGTNIAPLKGKNLQNGLVEPCAASSGCLNCKENNLVCVICDTLSDWWLDNNLCTKGTLIPEGKGKNIAQGKVETCSTGCSSCLSDSSKCTRCNTVADFWLENERCISGTAIPPGKGRKLNDGTLAPCTSGIGCLNCASNNTICQTCDRNTDWWLESGVCILGSTLTPGKGRNLLNGQVSPCSLVGCLFCHADHTICKRVDCLAANDQWLDELSNICIPKGNIPPGKGPNLALGTVVNCASAACKDCGTDYLLCTKCDVAAGFWLYENICHQKTSFGSLPRKDTTVGLGVNYEFGIVAPCTISNCSNCADFFGLCAQCNSGYELINQLCTCKASSNCSECGLVSGSCTKCESNYLLINGKCERPSEEIKLEYHTAFFEFQNNDCQVKFRDVVNPINPDELVVTLIDLEGSEQGTPFECENVLSLESTSKKDCKIHLTPQVDGFKFKLAMSKSINKGKLVIKPKKVRDYIRTQSESRGAVPH
jgi:hypothetical protein